jgi:hypothetical protein
MLGSKAKGKRSRATSILARAAATHGKDARQAVFALVLRPPACFAGLTGSPSQKQRAEQRESNPGGNEREASQKERRGGGVGRGDGEPEQDAVAGGRDRSDDGHERDDGCDHSAEQRSAPAESASSQPRTMSAIGSSATAHTASLSVLEVGPGVTVTASAALGWFLFCWRGCRFCAGRREEVGRRRQGRLTFAIAAYRRTPGKRSSNALRLPAAV